MFFPLIFAIVFMRDMEDIAKFSFWEFRFSAPVRPHTCRGFFVIVYNRPEERDNIKGV